MSLNLDHLGMKNTEFVMESKGHRDPGKKLEKDVLDSNYQGLSSSRGKIDSLPISYTAIPSRPTKELNV
jgi:hypothetical protein